MGVRSMKELTIEAKVDNLAQVTEFIDELLEAAECSMKAQMQIDVAVEELFVNVAHYAYGDSVGMVTVKASAEDGTAVITLIDSGIPYDPLKKPDPDITLSAQERAIGGLGIFMVKKTMDKMEYEYTDGKNVLTITKKIS